VGGRAKRTISNAEGVNGTTRQLFVPDEGRGRTIDEAHSYSLRELTGKKIRSCVWN
jgi:hypothetical protein